MTQTQMGFYEQGKADYLQDARRVAKRLLVERGNITTDDIWTHCPPPKFINSKIMGQIFRSPDFEPTGNYVKSRRATSHGRAIQQFKLRGVREPVLSAPKAISWLDD